RDDAERGEELLDQVVLFVVERCAAERADAEGAIDFQRALAGLDLGLPGRLPSRDYAIGDHLHRLLERERFPFGAVGTPVLDPVLAQRARHETLRGRALRAETTARDRACRIALDLRDLVAFGIDELPAADRTVRADGLRHSLRLPRPWGEVGGWLGARRPRQAERISSELLQNGPAADPASYLHRSAEVSGYQRCSSHGRPSLNRGPG